MPPTQSKVWNYFTRSVDKKSAKCNLCRVDLTYAGTTSNLNNHLKSKHPSTENSSDDTKKQASMTSFVQTPRKLSGSQSERVTQAIADMIVKDYVPLSIVEGEGFLQLMELVAPDYKVPCRNTVRARIVKRYDSEKDRLTSELASVPTASITTDTWTSNSTESYITVTEHHITDDWEMKANVLITRAMPERHTGENLANKLKDCVSEFGLDGKIEMCVHDNARNIQSAGEKCEDWGDLGCFAHTLQLCIKPALELQSVNKTIGKCRKLVGHFKHSTTVTAEMRKRQILLGEKQHALIQDVPTRWNSTQLMMERLVEQRRVITDIMLDSRVTKKNDSLLLLKDHEWDIISDLSGVLGVLTDVTTYMSGELGVSCSEIFPIVHGLVNGCLKITSEDSGLIVKVKDTISDELIRRFQPSSEVAVKSTPMLASLLDPRYKRLPFLSSAQRLIVEETLECHIDEVPLKLPSRGTGECEPTPSKRRKLNFLVFDVPEKEQSDELKCYLLERMDPDAKPLEWWRENQLKFPKIAHVARKVLSIPATSVPSERIFSSAGRLVNKLRNRLSSELVDNIIFLNKNKVPKRKEESNIE